MLGSGFVFYGIRFVPTSFFAKQKRMSSTALHPFLLIKIEPALLGFNFVFGCGFFFFQSVI